MNEVVGMPPLLPLLEESMLMILLWLLKMLSRASRSLLKLPVLLILVLVLKTTLNDSRVAV